MSHDHASVAASMIRRAGKLSPVCARPFCLVSNQKTSFPSLMPPQPFSSNLRAQPPVKHASPLNPFGLITRCHSAALARTLAESSPRSATRCLARPQVDRAKLQSQQQVAAVNWLQQGAGSEARAPSFVTSCSGESTIARW